MSDLTTRQRQISCFGCLHTWNVALPVARHESCEKCHRDAHTCKNCGNHDSRYHNECKESQAEHVVDREKSNFCSYFEPKTHSQPTAAMLEAERSKNSLESLFAPKDKGSAVGQTAPAKTKLSIEEELRAFLEKK